MEAAAADVEALLTVSATGERVEGRPFTWVASEVFVSGDLLGDLLLMTGFGGGIKESPLLGFAAGSGDILLGDLLPSWILDACNTVPLLGLGDFGFTSLLEPLVPTPLLLFTSVLLSLLWSLEASLLP